MNDWKAIFEDMPRLPPEAFVPNGAEIEARQYAEFVHAEFVQRELSRRIKANHQALSLEEIICRYPRLIRAMQWAACLSTGEAASAIHAHHWSRASAGEAVDHFGGVKAVLETAIQRRSVLKANNWSIDNFRHYNDLIDASRGE